MKLIVSADFGVEITTQNTRRRNRIFSSLPPALLRFWKEGKEISYYFREGGYKIDQFIIDCEIITAVTLGLTSVVFIVINADEVGRVQISREGNTAAIFTKQGRVYGFKEIPDFVKEQLLSDISFFCLTYGVDTVTYGGGLQVDTKFGVEKQIKEWLQKEKSR